MPERKCFFSIDPFPKHYILKLNFLLCQSSVWCICRQNLPLLRNFYPVSPCGIPENSKSPCWFIKDLGGGPISFLLSFGHVLVWVKLFLSQSIWTFQCHTVTNGPDVRKSPPGQAGLLSVFSRQQDYNSGELLWDLHPSDHGQRGLLRLQPAHEICGFWVQSNCEAYAGNLLFHSYIFLLLNLPEHFWSSCWFQSVEGCLSRWPRT